MIKQIRSWAFQWLLHFAHGIAPDTENGRKAKLLIGSYFDVFKK